MSAGVLMSDRAHARVGTVRFRRYAAPILITAAAGVATLLLYPVLSRSPSVLFISAVAISAWLGGARAGLLATGFGTLVFEFLFIDPLYSLAIESPLSVGNLIAFVGVELLITFLTAVQGRDMALQRQAVGKLRGLTSEFAERANAAEAGYREIAVLHEISGSVLATTNLCALADQVVAAAMRIGPYDLGLLRLVRPDGTFDVAANRGYRDPSHLPPVGPHPRLNTWVKEKKTPIVVADVSAAPDFPLMQSEGVRSLVVVPIVADEEALGVLLMGSRSPRPFDAQEIKSLQAVGEQAGIALQKARLSEQARAATTLLEGTLESTADGILVVDADGTILRYNKKFEQLCGLPAAVLASGCGERVTFGRDQLVNPDPFERKIWELYANPDAESFDVLEFRNGRVYERYSRALRIDGQPPVRVWSFRDITERRAVERRLLQAQRLEAAGRVAGQVAHDFNNLLSPLVALPELMKLQLPLGHPSTGYCDLMTQAAEQMAQINEDLMTLGRRGHFEQVRVDLNQLIRQVLANLGPDPETLVMDLRLAPDLFPVKGASAQLARTLMNLIVNAREAMQETGVLTISTENIYLDQSIGATSRVPVGEYVRLSVADSGPGIPPEVREHMFEPFFTTKASGRRRGSGLGLSIVQAVVEDHDAYIDVQSELGQGSRFSVFFRAVREEVALSLPTEATGGCESILVVDDDPLQRTVAQEVLRSLGYRVQTASSGEEAVAMVAAEPADLLILDMIMPPGIDGAETYRRIREHAPTQAAILVSGFAESDRVSAAQAFGAGAYVRKPVTRERLAAAVRTELNRNRRERPSHASTTACS